VAENALNFGRETEIAFFCTIQSHIIINRYLLVLLLVLVQLSAERYKRLRFYKKKRSSVKNLSPVSLRRIELDFFSASYRTESSLIGSSKGFHIPGRQHSRQKLLSNSTSFAPNTTRPWFLVHLRKGTWKSNQRERPEKSILGIFMPPFGSYAFVIFILINLSNSSRMGMPTTRQTWFIFFSIQHRGFIEQMLHGLTHPWATAI